MDGTSHDPQLLKGVLRMLVLQVLLDEETYGYELVTRLTARGLAGISTGTVYPVLNRLEKEGLLGSRLVASSAGPARKYYAITELGTAALREAIHGWQGLVAAVHAVLESGMSAMAGADDAPAAHATTTKGKSS